MTEAERAAVRVLVVWYRQHHPHNCFYCGAKLLTRPRRSPGWPKGRPKPNQLTTDHVIPVSGGGLRDSGNEVACCYPCNQKKDDLSLERFRHNMQGFQWLVDGKFYGERQFANFLHREGLQE